MKKQSLAAVSLTLLVTGLTAPSVTAGAERADAVDVVASRQVAFAGENTSFGGALSQSSCDVNGDQIDDTVVGDQNWNRQGHEKVGAAYVILGSATQVGGNVTDPSSANAIRLDGMAKTVSGGIWAGFSVSCLGDVNGDGFDDVVVGHGSRMHHQAAVVFGAKDFGPADLGNLGERGYLINDPGADDTDTRDRATDNFGYSVGSAGDVDGDGLDDIAVSDLLADYNGNNAGRVWIVKGKKTSTDVDVQVDTDQVIMTIDGTEGSRLAGATSVGDANGDGKADLVIGAYTATPYGTSAPVAGAAYVVHGGVSSQVVLGTEEAPGFDVFGSTRGRDRLGMSVAAIGDVNDDGLTDFIAGGDGVTNGTATRNGGAAIVLGSASTNTVMTDPTSEISVFECADGSVSDDCAGSEKIARGHWINGASTNSKAGFAVAGVDGTGDVLVGAYGESPRGAAYLLHVDGERTSPLELADLTPEQGERFIPELGSGAYGRTLASVGDFDGNGAQDFWFGGASTTLAMVLRGDLDTELTATAGAAVEAGVDSTLDVRVAPLLEQFAADVNGTVTLTVDGAQVDGSTEVVKGVAAVAVPALAKGAHTLSVSFVPAAGAGVKAAEATAALEVAPRAAKGRLSLDSRSVSVGDEVEAVLTSAQDLTGEVAFVVDGAQAGAAALVDGEAVVTLSGLDAGQHTVKAVYAGDDTFAGFETATTTLRVNKVDAEIGAVKVSRNSLVAGTGPVTVTVAVPGAAAGTVNLYDNGARVGAAAVRNGVATFTLASPKAGSHALSARFLGNTDLKASGLSDETVVQVRQARLAKVKVVGKKFAKGKKPKVTVTLGKLDNGAYPVGKVTVTSGGRTWTKAVTAASQGKVVVTLKASTAKVSVRASFTPTDRVNVAPATSAKVTVGMRR